MCSKHMFFAHQYNYDKIDESQSHKVRKIANYDTKFKLEAMSHAKLPSNHYASKVVNEAVSELVNGEKKKTS